jgi:hypothetical protein
MSEGTPARETLFARLLCDVMIPAEFSAAIRAQGYDVAEARVLPVEIQQDDHAILRAAAQQRRVNPRDKPQIYTSASRSALASWRSAVSKPSVNQP